MAKYLLDTTAPISYTRHRQDVVALVEGLLNGNNQVGICAIGVAEFYSFVRPHEKEAADRLIARLEFFDTTPQMAVEAGRYRYEFARQSITLTITDTITAAVAIANDATLVTANVRDFPMPEVRLLPHNP